MRKWKINSYVLSVCLLISEYVRQQQQDAKPSEDSVASLTNVPHTQPHSPAITRKSLSSLARFLSLEIQHPMNIKPQNTGIRGRGFTTLKNLLRRLEITLDNGRDFEQLSWQVVSSLTQIESPDSVCNVVEQISECVAPLQITRDGEEDMGANSANSTLVRTSLLGVFVRSFLLEVNRLLFDGLSRLFDDIEQYLRQFRQDVESEKRKEEKELVSSPELQNMWNEGKVDNNELLLSPIHSEIAMLSDNTIQHNLVTPLALKLDPAMLPPKLSTPEADLAVHDPALWSNDQLNYILSDVVRDLEGRRSSGHSGDRIKKEELRTLCSNMDGSTPSVLFARYLSFLNDRDYQGALDSLHHYHDVLSPRKSSDSASSRVAGMPFRGSGIQYAALNLAGLQILFDHGAAAEASIQEAIRVAQHHGDHICVAFALAWLIRINQKRGQSKEAVFKLARSCLARAQDLCLPSLQVLAMLSQVERDFVRGNATRSETIEAASPYMTHRLAAQTPAPRPLYIWSQLQDTIPSIASIATPAASFVTTSSRTMMALQMQAGGRSDVDTSRKCDGMGVEWIKSTEALLDTVWQLSGQVTIFAAVGWHLFGHSSLAQVYSQMHLMCYEGSASTGEIALTVSQMAMAKLTLSQGDATVYEHALTFLVNVATGNAHHVHWRHLFNDPIYQKTLHRLFFLWGLQRGEFACAKAHVEAMLALSPKEKDLPEYLAAMLLTATLETAMGDYVQSLEVLERLETTCREHGFTYLHAQVLIATSRTRFHASAPHAPFACLNTLLKSIDICTSHQYDLLLAEAHVVMAEVYLAMGKMQDAHALISDQMSFVMEHGSVNLRGECKLLLAKIMIATITRSNKGANEPARAAPKAIEMLGASAEMFASAQNLRRLKEISYVQSLVYNHMATLAEKSGEKLTLYETKREDAAKRFLTHSTRLEKAAFYPLEPFFDMENPESVRRVIAHRSRV